MVMVQNVEVMSDKFNTDKNVYFSNQFSLEENYYYCYQQSATYLESTQLKFHQMNISAWVQHTSSILILHYKYVINNTIFVGLEINVTGK